jgi:hypothetical protein
MTGMAGLRRAKAVERATNKCEERGLGAALFLMEMLMIDTGTHGPGDPKERRAIFGPAIAVLVVIVIAAGIWTYLTRDWNASGTQKVGSPVSTAPSEKK